MFSLQIQLLNSIIGYTSPPLPILAPKRSQTKPEVRQDTRKTHRFLEKTTTLAAIMPLSPHDYVQVDSKLFLSVNVSKYIPFVSSKPQKCILPKPEVSQSCKNTCVCVRETERERQTEREEIQRERQREQAGRQRD